MSYERWTEEQIDYLKEITPGRFTYEIARMMNEKFGTSRTTRAIINKKIELGICSGARGQKEDGYIRYDQKGRIVVCRKQPDGSFKFVSLARDVWEKANGPIPPGHKIIFIDGNNQNVTLDNLFLISNVDHIRLMNRGAEWHDRETLETQIALSNLDRLIAKKDRRICPVCGCEFTAEDRRQKKCRACIDAAHELRRRNGY